MMLILHNLILLMLAPAMLGVINKTKAWFSGRTGAPIIQPYFTLAKLLRKGAVYSDTTTWIFRTAPIITLSAALVAAMIIPIPGSRAPLAFGGDLFLFAYLLGVMRFATVLGALDTGSSFEGMGASREVTFAALAEPVLLLSLGAIAWLTKSTSLSEINTHITMALWAHSAAPMTLICVALFTVFLAENSRLPVDDPNTHLELTMIHEVMILDHSGPDLAFIHLAASIKHWLIAALIAGIIVPSSDMHPRPALLAWIGVMVLIAMLTAGIESSIARLRLLYIPKLLVGASAISFVAVMLVLR